MASDEEWGASNEDFQELEDILYEGVAHGDFTESELRSEIEDIGPPGDWESGVIVIDGDGDYFYHVVDSSGESHEFFVGNVRDERGIDDLYDWSEENDVPEFDVLYEEGKK